MSNQNNTVIIPLIVKVAKSKPAYKQERKRNDVFLNTGNKFDIPENIKSSVQLLDDGTIQFIGNNGVIKIPVGEFVGYEISPKRCSKYLA